MIKFSLAAQKLAHISPTADFDSSVKYGPGQREEKRRELRRKDREGIHKQMALLTLWNVIAILPSRYKSPFIACSNYKCHLLQSKVWTSRS